MRYLIRCDIKKPAYLQLYEQLKHDIVAGYYENGHKLPSKRVLSADAQVSVITVTHAYELLCDEGYVKAEERSGYFAVYRAGDFMSTNSQKPMISPVNMLQHRNAEAFPFSVLAKTMRKVISDKGELILTKSPNCGLFELQNAISMYLARSVGIEVRPEQIIVGSGAEYLYGIIVQLLGRNRVFAAEQPSYYKISEVYAANSVRLEKLPLGKNGIESDALKSTNASVLHVTPFNSYPSGVSANASKRNEYLRWAKSSNAFIIEDNYDSELTVSDKLDDTLFSEDTDGRVIYLNTFSNTIAPSLRIGYMILPESMLEVYNKRLGFYSCTVPVFDQYVLAELLQSGEFERHINRVRRARRNAALSEHK